MCGGDFVKRPVKPVYMRRVWGLAMLCMALGMIFSWFFLGASFIVGAALLIAGFYLFFM